MNLQSEDGLDQHNLPAKVSPTCYFQKKQTMKPRTSCWETVDESKVTDILTNTKTFSQHKYTSLGNREVWIKAGYPVQPKLIKHLLKTKNSKQNSWADALLQSILSMGFKQLSWQRHGNGLLVQNWCLLSWPHRVELLPWHASSDAQNLLFGSPQWGCCQVVCGAASIVQLIPCPTSLLGTQTK